MKKKEFSNGLIVVSKKNQIAFENKEKYEKDKTHGFEYLFEEDEFKEFANYMWEEAKKVWVNIIPKDATSEATDYYSSYDKDAGNESALGVSSGGLRISPAFQSEKVMYKFTRGKMKSFLFDLRKLCPQSIVVEKNQQDLSKRLGKELTKLGKIKKSLVESGMKQEEEKLKEIIQNLRYMKEEIEDEFEYEVEL